MKAFAIVASVLIIVFALVYGLVRLEPWDGSDRSFRFGRSVNESVEVPLDGVNHLELRSSLSSVKLRTDPAATAVSATLTGSISGFGPDEQTLLRTGTDGDTARIQAGTDGPNFFFGSQRLMLEITVPAGYAGSLNCESAAGSIEVTSPLNLAELKVDSSAGAVRLGDATITGALVITSSAGAVEAGSLTADTIEVRSSAGPVRVAECHAQDVTLHSSAGAVEVQALSGQAQIDSSAGSVHVRFTELTGDSSVKSSAGSVEVRLPANTNAALAADSSAGHVTVDNLTLSDEQSERDHVTGTLGSGGPRLTVHSSAGSVQIIGE